MQLAFIPSSSPFSVSLPSSFRFLPTSFASFHSSSPLSHLWPCHYDFGDSQSNTDPEHNQAKSLLVLMKDSKQTTVYVGAGFLSLLFIGAAGYLKLKHYW